MDETLADIKQTPILPEVDRIKENNSSIRHPEEAKFWEAEGLGSLGAWSGCCVLVQVY